MLPYGVHAATNRKHIVIAALAILTSAVSVLLPWLDLNDSTFIFLAFKLRVKRNCNLFKI